MSRYGGLIVALLLASTGAACSRQADETPASPPPPAPLDGVPQIANSADGVHIQYRVHGRGDPAVVLVHGWSCDSNYWNAQLPALRQRYTVVTLDLAGHGASGRNRSEWSMASYGEDVAAVVRQIPNGEVVLVGHSMGGPVALEAADRIGDRVIGIIGVDTLKTIGMPPVPPAEVEQRLKEFRADFVGATRRYVTEHLLRPDSDPQLARKIADDMALAPEDVAIGSIVALNAMDFSAVLPHIHVPLVAINSDYGEAADEARIRKHAPTFRAVVLEGTGHFPMMEAPQRFNPVLLREIQAIVDHARG